MAPDDFQHYLDDGLIAAEYAPYYPVTLSVSPYLAAVRRDGESREGLERLLDVRSRQVMDLLAARTRALLGEPAMRFAAEPDGPPRHGGSPRIVAKGRTRQLGDGGRHVVSLVLPVKNQERDVRELLPLVLSQSAAASLEIIAVDSGSEDGTVEALREFEATVIAIDPADFDHGLTRNLAAEHARGDVLLFVSGRSRPANDRWLAPLLSTLDEDPAAAGVCSRVLPRRDASLLVTRDGDRELSGASDRRRMEIGDWRGYRDLSAETRRAFINFHTVSAAVRADAFARIGFRSVDTLGEDLLWARETLEAGWTLWHEPASVAYHSHEYTLGEWFSRNVDDGLANREINARTLAEPEALPLIRAMVADDWAYLRDTLQLGGEELDHWMLEAVLRRVAQVMGQWVGVNHGELPEGMAAHFSGVGRARRGR